MIFKGYTGTPTGSFRNAKEVILQMQSDQVRLQHPSGTLCSSKGTWQGTRLVCIAITV